VGRPRLAPEVRDLIAQMASEIWAPLSDRVQSRVQPCHFYRPALCPARHASAVLASLSRALACISNTGEGWRSRGTAMASAPDGGLSIYRFRVRTADGREIAARMNTT
jgi:hypothetical protein